MELGDQNLKVQRASIGYTQASGLELGVNAMSMFAGTQSADFQETRVLQLLNMVTAEELIDNDEYEGQSITWQNAYVLLFLGLSPVSLPPLKTDGNSLHSRTFLHDNSMRSLRNGAQY